MQPIRVIAISPIFSFEPDTDRFCTHRGGRENLELIGETLAQPERRYDLVGLYVPQISDPHDRETYNDDPETYGRIIAAIRVLRLKPGETVDDLPSGCLEFKGGELQDRWPLGWRCEVVFYSLYGGPFLRDAVEMTMPGVPFASFAHQLYLHGPMPKLAPALTERLTTEVRHRMTVDPATRIRP